MVTQTETPKQFMLGLTLHRITGTKGTVINLHRFGHTISYNSFISYSDKLFELAIPANQRLLQSIPVHYSIDNDDGWQEADPGFDATHDINTMLLLWPVPGENTEYMKKYLHILLTITIYKYDW